MSATIESMTGFGRGEISSPGKKFIAELKSLNHRFLDIRCRLPRPYQNLETALNQLIQTSFRRGRFDLEIRVESEPGQSSSSLPNLRQAENILQALNQLKESLGLPGEINLELLAGRREIWESEPDRSEVESDWEPIKTAVETACRELKQMRIKEGETIGRDIARRLEKIGETVQEIQHHSQDCTRQIREKIHRTVRDALGETPVPNPDRLELEIALLAERSDITEELTRLHSHLQQFRESLGKKEESGKKLEFILQEMGRETNTIGSKSTLSEVSSRVIEIKMELEKIREQVQNIA